MHIISDYDIIYFGQKERGNKMYKIVRKVKLNPTIYLMDILAPLVAKSALPGQFIIVRKSLKSIKIFMI